jgi:hypothetical protein
LNESKILTAHKPITVYKYLYPSRTGTFAYSPFYLTRWRKGQIKEVKHFGLKYNSFIDKLPDYISIVNYGLHSYSSLRRARANGTFIIECQIPKDTKYIRGKYNEIVSLKLKVIRAINGNKSQVKAFNKRKVKSKNK